MKTYKEETNFASRKQKNIFPHVKNTNFASDTYVSQKSHHENNVDYLPVLLERVYSWTMADGDIGPEEPQAVHRKGKGKKERNLKY